MGYFCPKNAFLQLKHYIQRIYLISPIIFETISHFSRHNSSVFFSSNIAHFLQKQTIKVGIFRLSTAQVKVQQIPHVIFQTKRQFFFPKLRSFFSVLRDHSSVLFLVETLYAIDKIGHESASFQTCHCSHLNSPNFSCHF